VAEGADDGEGELLRRIRAGRTEVPLAVALDLHGNITQAMVEAADVMVGFRPTRTSTCTRPARTRRGCFSTGSTAARGRGSPGAAAAVVAHAAQRHRRGRDAARGAAGAADGSRRAARASVFAGFSLADIPRRRPVDRHRRPRQRTKRSGQPDRLARQAWDERDGFVYRSEPLAESVARARRLRQPGRPVLLLDHGDNVMSGGTCDTTTLLEESCARA